MRACGLQGSYSLFPIPADDAGGLADITARVRTGEIRGLNVTIPHKQTVIRCLDDLTPTARAIGAVNTIYVNGARLIGDNTDAAGFLLDLKNFLNTAGRPADHQALMIGAGGAAHAVAYALLHDGWQVTIAARRLEQARRLAGSFPDYQIQIAESAGLQGAEFNLIVNTTPVGMVPDTDQSPWPENLPFPSGAAVYDLVYNPPETRLVKDACSEGLPATTGLGMLIEQAALAFTLWTGYNPPRQAMLRAAKLAY